MTYPALAAVLLGVSLATLLYYMFSDNSQEYQQSQNSRSSHGDRGAPEQSWNGTDSNNYQRRRHDSYNSGGSDECTICLSNMREDPNVRLQPCGHMFHYLCIKRWETLGPERTGALCPICRHPFKITPI